MKQQTLAMANGFERYTKKMRRTLFLEEMEQVVPWAELCALIEPVYAKAGDGRPLVGAERMLRIYFLQQWFNLSDPGVEEALYDSVGMRQFVGIDLGREPVPDETTVCKFRHLLEEHELGERLFERVGEHLQQKGRACAFVCGADLPAGRAQSDAGVASGRARAARSACLRTNLRVGDGGPLWRSGLVDEWRGSPRGAGARRTGIRRVAPARSGSQRAHRGSRQRPCRLPAPDGGRQARRGWTEA
jgi:hypothetical protein